MKINSNYSLSRLFVSKEIKITVDQKYFTIVLKTVRDSLLDEDWTIFYQLLTRPSEQVKKSLSLDKQKSSSFIILNLILFKIGMYDVYRRIYDAFKKTLLDIIPGLDIDTGTKTLKVKDITITEEIWEYIIYLLKLSNGEKVEKPLTFDSEEAKQFYLAQKAAEERIAKIKSQSRAGDIDAIPKMMLSITYAFPSFSFDYLYNQTLAQIRWLQSYAAGATSYEVNAQAFAAGNVKKGKKLDFFIK